MLNIGDQVLGGKIYKLVDDTSHRNLVFSAVQDELRKACMFKRDLKHKIGYAGEPRFELGALDKLRKLRRGTSMNKGK